MTPLDPPPSMHKPVLLDTNVASRLLPGTRDTQDPRRLHWMNVLQGRTLVICAQVRAELLTWPLVKNWGDPRQAQLHQWLHARPLIPVDEKVQAEYAAIKAWARGSGHAFHDKGHAADLWIAASAVAFSLPLATEDGTFAGIPRLALISRPQTLEDQ